MKVLAAAVPVLIGIVFLSSSAFIKKQQNTSLEVYEVWGIRCHEVSNQYYAPAGFAELQCSMTEVLYFSPYPLISIGYNSLQEFIASYSNGEINCTVSNNYVCLAYVTYDLDYAAEGLVLEVVEGDYEHIY